MEDAEPRRSSEPGSSRKRRNAAAENRRSAGGHEAAGNADARKVLGEANRDVSTGSGIAPPGWALKGAGSAVKSARKSRAGHNQSSVSNNGEDTNGGAADDDASVAVPTDTIDSLACSCFGSVSDRDNNKADLLRRAKPEQRLFGYPKQYVEKETRRLALGVKAQINARDQFIDACKDHERALRTAVESAKYRLDQVAQSSRSARVKLEEAEKEVSDLRKQESVLQGELAVARSELGASKQRETELAEAKQEAERKRAALDDQVEQLRQQLLTERDKAAAATAELEQATAARDKAQAALEEAAKQQQAALDAAAADAAARVQAAQVEKGTLVSDKARLEGELEQARAQAQAAKEEAREAESKARSTEEEVSRLRHTNEGLSSQLANIESQSRQKDVHLERTLDTFQQNQTFSQARIASLSDEKAKLEERVHDLAAAKSELEVRSTRLEGSVKELTESCATLKAELEKKTAEADGMRDTVQELTDKVEAAAREAAAASVKADKACAELAQERRAHASKLEALTAEREALQSELEETKEQNANLESEVSAVKNTYGKGGAGEAGGDAMQELLKVTKEMELLKRHQSDAAGLQHELQRLRQALQDTEEKLFQSDKAKRDLHNEVQALKGKVRVVARVRPLFGGDKPSGTPRMQALPDYLACSVDGSSLTMQTEQEQSQGTTIKKHQFTFDRVFVPSTTQEQVFEEVSSFVQSALDGYNVCLFSYGQTGSGKTHTMTGVHDCPERRGIIPRSIDQIMSYQTELRAKGWEYALEATYVEIYNEAIRDLLRDPRGAETGPKLEIRDSKKELLVSNATRLPIGNKDEIHRILDLAERNRSVASTDLNLHSSRSHSVFTLFLKGVHREFGAEVSGSLSMCDLAGSERISRSGASGERLKETQAINKSLSSLANVFAALQKKSPHVPYRNSKLTHMLQPCFAGEGKTMMIVNLSPEAPDRNESLCSLRFAGQVSQTELGRAKKNIAALASAS